MLTGHAPFSGPTPLAIMNARLLNHPVPPREVNPSISPQLQEILYRALERDPKNRYANARELAWELSHQDSLNVDQVNVERRTERMEEKQDSARSRKLFYAMLALLPAVVLVLLLVVARRA
jgi:serine/threonine-protein kinase